jgi:hypothetical protein
VQAREDRDCDKTKFPHGSHGSCEESEKTRCSYSRGSILRGGCKKGSV